MEAGLSINRTSTFHPYQDEGFDTRSPSSGFDSPAADDFGAHSDDRFGIEVGLAPNRTSTFHPIQDEGFDTRSLSSGFDSPDVG